MAKRKTRGDALTATAESVGAALGRVAARLDAWKRERTAIVAEVQKIVRAGHTILSELGSSGAGRPSARERPKNKGGRPKGYTMSEETKRKLRAAWKRRKAAAKTPSGS
jgi:hypothetical protein